MPESGSLTAAMARLRPADGTEISTAVGGVVLALAAYVIDLRMSQWALGPRFIVAGVIAGLLLGMGWSIPGTGSVARPHQSLLLIAGLLVLVIALEQFGEILAGHHHLGAGGVFWTIAVEAAVALAAARRANSAGCTLIAGFAAAVSLLAFVGWVFHPTGFGTYRWILFVESVALAAGAVRLRADYRRHAVQLINVAGLLALFLALTFVGSALISGAGAQLGTALSVPSIGPAGGGWKIYVLVAIGALIAYSVVDREPAPGVIGVAVALTFAVLVGLHPLTGGSLVFWPLFLLIVGGVAVAVSLSGGLPAGPGAAPASVATNPPPPTTPSPTTSMPPPTTPSEPPQAE
jgi:hypothetical protein